MTGGTAVGLVLIMVAGFLVLYNTVQVPINVLNAPLQQSSVVYFANGRTPVGCFCSVDRSVVTASQISKSKYLAPAFFAAEDRHFMTEGGISITGTMRALLVDLSGSGYQGASTITEQVAKRAYDPCNCGNLTISEKVKEVIAAIKLAKMESKSWILTNYLNYIYLGDGAYGVQAAAETYFGVPISKLTLSQAAMIAAMPNQPGYFNPDPKSGAPYKALVARWQYVLANMVRDGVITQAQASAQKFPAIVQNQGSAG